jgi:ABC-2 type transport system permease protein
VSTAPAHLRPRRPTRRSGLAAQARRGWQITSAFTWLGYTEELAYPLNFALKQLQPIFTVVVYYFLSLLVDPGPDVASDYYSFVVVGAVVIRMLDSGLGAFSATLEATVSQGRLESLLVEPIRWKLIPFGLASWSILTSAITAAVMTALGLAMGVNIEMGGVIAAFLILVLGIGASHALGIVAAAVKLISKRGNPFVTIYGMAVVLLCGLMFPVASLPVPLRAASYLLPPTYAIQGVRRTLLPGGEALTGPSTMASVLVLAGFCVLIYPVSLWLYGRSVDIGRRYGTLAGY